MVPETAVDAERDQVADMLEFCIKVPRMLGHRGMAIDYWLAEAILARLRAHPVCASLAPRQQHVPSSTTEENAEQ